MSRLNDLRNKYPGAPADTPEIPGIEGVVICSAAHVSKRFGYDDVIDEPDAGLFGVFDGSLANPVIDTDINLKALRVMEAEEPLTSVMEAKRQMKEQLELNKSSNLLVARIVSIDDSVYAVFGNKGNAHAYSYQASQGAKTIAGRNAPHQSDSGYFAGVTVHEVSAGERFILATNGGLASVQKQDMRGNNLTDRILGARSPHEVVKGITQMDNTTSDKAYVVFDVDFVPRKQPKLRQPLGATALDGEAKPEELKLSRAPGSAESRKAPKELGPFHQLHNVMEGFPPNYDGSVYVTKTEQLTSARPLAAVGFTWMETEGNRWFKVKKFHHKGDKSGNFEIVEIVALNSRGRVKFAEIAPRRDTQPYDDGQGGRHYGILVQQFVSIPEFTDMLKRKMKLEDLANKSE